MRKAEKLYNHLEQKNKDKLFTERNMFIGLDLWNLSDEEFNKILEDDIDYYQ